MRLRLENILSEYKDADFDLQLKARFFFFVCLTNFIIVLLIIASIIHMNKNFSGLGTISPIPQIISLFFIAYALILLVKGKFTTSAHIIAIVNQVAIWVTIIIDKNESFVRLDTISFVFCILAILPLAVNKHRSVFLFYGASNLIFLLGFMFFERHNIQLSAFAVNDYLRDNITAIIIATIFAYYNFSINRAALEKTKTEIKERNIAENTVRMQKAELENYNRELASTLLKIELTARELKAANIQYEETQKKLIKANQLLRESEEKFSTVFHKSPFLIGLMDYKHGKFTDISDSLSKIAGYSIEEATGHTSGELNMWAREEEYKKIKNVLKAGDKLNREEITVKGKDGRLFILYLSSEIVTINKVPHIILMGIDVTELRKSEEEKLNLEKQLIQAQKLEAIGHLSGGIAHDFNNMLSVVMGCTDILHLDKQLSKTAQRQVEHIRDAAERSAGLVRQLLAFARKQPANPIVLNLNDTIKKMLSMLNRLIGENIQLFWFPAKDAGNILIDPTQIDQILANIMVNARTAIKGAGKIKIETSIVCVNQIDFIGKTDGFSGNYTALSISDNGIGMDKATIDKIFEPFFTTNKKGMGTGLGLATVYGIVKQNNGFIKVESKPGEGSTFIMYFPTVESREQAQAKPKVLSLQQQEKRTILIVEDDNAILEIGKSILEHLGYTVLAVNEPEKAIMITQSHPGILDLLLTDVVMPKMNGKELADRISEIRPEIKVLFMSGYTTDIIANHGVLDEGTMFISKPFTIENLSNKLSEIFSRPYTKKKTDNKKHV